MSVSQNYLLIFSFAIFLCSPPIVQSRDWEEKNFFFFRMSTLVVRTWIQSHKKLLLLTFWLVSQDCSNVLWHMEAYAANQNQPDGLENYSSRCACLELCIVRTMNVKVLFSDTLKRHCKLGEDSVECRVVSDWVPRDLGPSVCRVENNLCRVENNLCIESRLDICQPKWTPKWT